MINNERAFTLIEMLIVLMIIAVLILLIIPTISNRSKYVHEEGCSALVLAVQTQADAYRLEKGKYPTQISELLKEKFITENQLKCKGDKTLTINEDGIVGVQNGS